MSLKIIYAGTPEFAATALAALLQSEHEVVAVYTQPDRPAGRGRKLTPSPVKALAVEHGLPVHQPLSLKDEQEQATLAAYGADLMVVAAYGLILPKAVLETPRLGCLNIHASLLPRWRGAAPIQRAIEAGDADTGITIMQMDVGLDTGDMLYKLATPIAADDNAQRLHDRLADMGAQAIVEALARLEAGELQAEPQDDAQANYAAKLSKAEAQVDWSEGAAVIARRVRAFNPWPVCQSSLEGDTLRIWEAEAIEATGDEPGTVVATSKKGIDIATGEGCLRLTRIQLPGRKPMSAADLLNSRSLDGARLGD